MKGIRRWLECRRVRGAVEAYLDGEAPHLRERIQAHLEQCKRCRLLAHALSAQARAIEAIPAEEEPAAEFVERVMQRIETAERLRAARSGSAPQAWRLSLASVSAAAAVVVLAVLLWFVAIRAPVPVEPITPTPVHEVAKTPPAPTVPSTAEKAPVPLESEARPVAIAKRTRPPVRVRTPAQEPTPPEPAEAELAQELRDSGREYEHEGELEDALAAYATARDEAGSTMAHIDVARVYERSGYTAQALDELVQVAFAELDEEHWETLVVQ